MKSHNMWTNIVSSQEIVGYTTKKAMKEGMHPIFLDEWHGHFVVVVSFRPERAFLEPQKYDVTTGVKRFFLDV